jgi:hypothetical protein
MLGDVSYIGNCMGTFWTNLEPLRQYYGKSLRWPILQC